MTNRVWIEVKRYVEEQEVSLLKKTIPAHINSDWHTEKCREAYLKWLGLQKDYKIRWPNSCDVCNGNGVISYRENLAPHGEGPWMCEAQDVCDKCTGQGKCARCGTLMDEDWSVEGDELCTFCGWNWGRKPDDAGPYDFECSCWHHSDYPPHQ